MPFRALAFLVPPLKASRYPAAFVLLALFAAALGASYLLLAGLPLDYFLIPLLPLSCALANLLFGIDPGVTTQIGIIVGVIAMFIGGMSALIPFMNSY